MCIRCRENQFLKNEFTCADCVDGFKPNDNLTACVPLPTIHLDWDSLWVLLPVSLSTLGILATGFVFYVFLRYNATPLIMASGRELCYVLLLGISMSYGTTFILLARPSIVLCTIKRFVLGMSLCLIYAAMLVKTNRIYRIFNRGIKAMVKRPSYTSPKSQIFICLSLVSVQVVGGLTWLGFEKPETVFERHYREYQVLTCKASQIAILLSLVYNMFLIILCTVFGILTRKIPQNFNEAKYIAFTMYSTCIVWLAFIPIYFGANHDFKVSYITIYMCACANVMEQQWNTIIYVYIVAACTLIISIGNVRQICVTVNYACPDQTPHAVATDLVIHSLLRHVFPNTQSKSDHCLLSAID